MVEWRNHGNFLTKRKCIRRATMLIWIRIAKAFAVDVKRVGIGYGLSS